MAIKLAIIPRIRRFRRNLAASLDEEVEHLSSLGRRTSHTLHRFGRSVASSLDTSNDYFEEDPVGAFLEKAEKHFDSASGEEAETPGFIDIIEPGTNATQDSKAAKQKPTSEQPKSSTKIPDEGARPVGKLKLESSDTGDSGKPFIAEKPQEPAVSEQSDTELTSIPAFDSTDPEIVEASLAETSSEDAADLTQLERAAETSPAITNKAQPPPPPDEGIEIQTMDSFETLSLEVDGQDLESDGQPEAENAAQSEAALPHLDAVSEVLPTSDNKDAVSDEVAGMTAMTNNEPLELASIDLNDGQGKSLEGEGTQSDKDADSLLDIFRSEEVEENPITELAKGLPDVDINHLLEKVRQFARELKGGV